MKKHPSRRPPSPHALRNLDHRPPVTRREFLGRGMLSAGATVVGLVAAANAAVAAARSTWIPESMLSPVC